MSRMRFFVAAAVAAGCIAVLFGISSGPAGQARSAQSYYHAGQRALVRNDLITAAVDFRRASQLINDPNERAWAQYQLGACLECQPSKRTEAIAALRSLIRDEPHHFLVARAQSDLDGLEGRSTPLNPPQAVGGKLPLRLRLIITHI